MTRPRPLRLSLSDLAGLTAVPVATLRIWQQRYGFPAADPRTPGAPGFGDDDVRQVHAVLARRAAGDRLDVAIDRVVDDVDPGRGWDSSS